MDAGSRLEPGAGNDERIHKGPLDAVKHRRLVPLVDDADRHQQHAGPEVQLPVTQKIQVGLLQLELAAFLESFDKGVLEFQLTDEADPVAKNGG